MDIQHVNVNTLAVKGEDIYATRLKALLEPAHQGKIVAIEIESGDYFLGDTVVEAGQKAKERYPDRVFYFIRVGYSAVHRRR
jgi:hypothetical protein